MKNKVAISGNLKLRCSRIEFNQRLGDVEFMSESHYERKQQQEGGRTYPSVIFPPDKKHVQV